MGVFKIISFNVNSVNRLYRRQQLDKLIKLNNPDFVLLSETHIATNHRLVISGFDSFITNRSTNGGGTAVLVKNTYRAKQISVGTCLFEYTAVSIYSNGGPITLVSVYAPSGIADFTDINRFDQNRIIFGGDFNARHTTYGDKCNNTNGNKLASVLSCNDNVHLHHSDAPTCYRLPDGSFLDHFITDFPISKVKSLPLCFSDHCPIMTSFNAEILTQSVPQYKDYRLVN